jgi:hypothetical protein
MSGANIPERFNNPKTLGPLPDVAVTGREGVQGEG